MFQDSEGKRMRKRLFQIIEPASEKDRLSNAYDFFMMSVIVVSLIPLAFKNEWLVFECIDKIAVVIFIIDYVLRLLTADMKLKKGKWSFLIYPITPMAIIDLLCILPSLSIINSGFRILKVFRLFRTFRVFRIFKAVRYSKSIKMIKGVFVRQRRPLMTVGLLAIVYVFISALVVFNVEPESFNNFFDAVYWATVSLTTVGYGDIYPVTVMGRIITMISSVFGIAIIALPSGIITAGFLDELNKNDHGIEESSETDNKSTDGLKK
jgi:voltage-gated potassium channel